MPLIRDIHEKTLYFHWNFQADLRQDEKLDLESEAFNLGFLGEWTLAADRDGGNLQLYVQWQKSLVGSVSENGVRATAILYALMGSHREQTITERSHDWSGAWPGTMTGFHTLLRLDSASLQSHALQLSLNLDTHRAWRVHVELKISSTAVAVAPRVMLPASFVESLHAPSNPGHVRLYFPKTDLELWTTEQTLVNASPYFATLFASGFAETIGTRSKRRRTEGGAATASAEVASEVEFDDSDDEADEIYVQDKLAAADPGDLEYREVRITSAKYSTYAALLRGLSSNKLDFAPLSARYRAQLLCDPDEDSRKDDLASFHDAHPSRAIPSSPKSLFRLTHFLEMPTLNAVALASYKSMLTKECVAFELVGDAVEVHEELRNAAIVVAAEDWETVRTSDAMREVVKLMADGDQGMKARFATVMGELLTERL